MRISTAPSRTSRNFVRDHERLNERVFSCSHSPWCDSGLAADKVEQPSIFQSTSHSPLCTANSPNPPPSSHLSVRKQQLPYSTSRSSIVLVAVGRTQVSKGCLHQSHLSKLRSTYTPCRVKKTGAIVRAHSVSVFPQYFLSLDVWTLLSPTEVARRARRAARPSDPTIV